MKTLPKIISVLTLLLLLCAAVPAWAETIPEVTVHLQAEMTLDQAAKANGVTTAEVAQALKTQTAVQTGQTVGQLLNGRDLQTASENLRKLIVEKKLEKAKNWPIIFTKLTLWALIMLGAALALSKRATTPKVRLWSALGVVAVIGFILGSDPNPLGMIKDALYIYGTTGVIFKPRIIVTAIVLLTVLLGGRLFCGWACHLGALQDLVYRVPVRKIRLPFWLTNLVRLFVLVGICIGSLVYATDILAPIDPYQIFNFRFTLALALTVGLILISGIFIYRPWCTLACPFGLLAWLTEKGSLWGIRFEPAKCVDCGSCEKVCPTGRAAHTRQGAKEKECYACGRCLEACGQHALIYRGKPFSSSSASSAGRAGANK